MLDAGLAFEVAFEWESIVLGSIYVNNLLIVPHVRRPCSELTIDLLMCSMSRDIAWTEGWWNEGDTD